MGIYGCLWVSWVFKGVSVFIGVYRCLRESMGVYGFPGVYGCLWISECLWVFVGVY